MADNKVSAKIKTDARARVKEIEKEYQLRMKQLETKHKEEAETYRAETKELSKKEAQRIHREMLSQARLEARKQILTARHELIQQAISQASGRLVKSKAYSTLLGRIVREYGKGAQVILSDSDRKRLKSASWAKKSLGSDITGGVILRTPTHDINFSLDAVFESIGESLLLDLAGILFSDLQKG
jgi:vacuolar-type H+-ATPase subunit E/Vma4